MRKEAILSESDVLFFRMRINSFEFPDCFFSVFFWGMSGGSWGILFLSMELNVSGKKRELNGLNGPGKKWVVFAGLGANMLHVLVLPSLKAFVNYLIRLRSSLVGFDYS